jgi:hypothetical protein
VYSAYDDEDLTYSLLYQLDATKRALADFRDYLRKRQAEQRELAHTLRAVPDLNPRQRALLDHALKNPDELITFLTHARTHDVTMVTARADVLELLQRKLLDEVGRGRQRSFLPVEDLAERLSRPRPKTSPLGIRRALEPDVRSSAARSGRASCAGRAAMTSRSAWRRSRSRLPAPGVARRTPSSGGTLPPRRRRP